MRKIPLDNGMTTIVDDEDYQWASQYEWRAKPHGSTFYAVRDVFEDGEWKEILLHEEIIKRARNEWRNN